MGCKEGLRMFANLIQPLILTLSFGGGGHGGLEGRQDGGGRGVFQIDGDVEEAFVCVCLAKLCMRAIPNICTSGLSKYVINLDMQFIAKTRKG